MTSAVKPPAAMRKSGEATKAIETMLQKGVSPTSSGLEAAKGAVDDLEIAIQTTLENSPGVVNPAKVASSIKSAFDEVKFKLGRVENEADINTALEKFLSHPEIAPHANQLPVAIANRLKQSFYAEVGPRSYVPGSSGQMSPTAYDKAQKSLAGGLKEAISQAEPNVVPNLKEQQEMMRVVNLLKERVGASQSQNIYGLGGAMSPSVTRLLIFWADRYPWFKGWAARALYSVATPVTAGAGVAAGLTGAEEIQEKIEKRNK